MVFRLVDLKNHIDDIFDEINQEFDSANQENAELRDALQRRSGRVGAGVDQDSNRRVNGLMDELDKAKRQREDLEDRLAHA